MTTAIYKKSATNGARRKRARGRVANPTDFGRVFYDQISNIGMSANQFAKHIGMSSGFISGVYSGLKKPPLDKIEQWADALKLHGSERGAFILLAHLEHASPLLRKMFKQYRKMAIAARDADIDVKGLDVDVLLQLGNQNQGN